MHIADEICIGITFLYFEREACGFKCRPLDVIGNWANLTFFMALVVAQRSISNKVMASDMSESLRLQ